MQSGFKSRHSDKNMKIAFDLDEVLAGFLPALIEFHNKKHNKNLKLEDFNSYNFWEIWGGTREEAIDEVNDFHRIGYSSNIKPIKGAEEAIKELKKDNELFVITSRYEEVSDETRLWLEKYFPKTFSDVLFSGDFTKKIGAKTKKEYCDILGIDVMVEDSFDFAHSCLDDKRIVILLNYPWNKDRNVEGHNIIRVNTWEEIVKKINEIKK